MKNWLKRSSKSFVSLLLAAVLALPLGGVGLAAEETAALVLKNAVIYTVEGSNWDVTPQQSLAVGKDGKFLYVGSDEGAQAYIGEGTQVRDMRGKVILPGLGDGHVHPPGTALTEMYNIYLYTSITREQTLKDIRAYIEANPELDAYWGSGFTMAIGGEEAEGRGPKKEWLDEICSDKPVILTSNDGHSRWLNSKALEMNGITKDTTHPTGMVQKGPDGALWGTLTDASSLITMSQQFSDEQQVRALASYQDSMLRWGYTQNSMILPSPEYVDYLLQMEKDGDWHIHANLATRFSPENKFEDDLKAFLDAREAAKDSKLIGVTTGKFFEDGVVEGMTAYLGEPYDPAAGLASDFVSVPLWDTETLKRHFDALMKNGGQIHVHAIGDEATTQTLDAMAYAQGQNPGVDARNTITHLQVVKDSDKVRMGQLHVIGSTQPFWHLKEPEWYEYVDKVALGEDRAYKEYPVKSLIDNGVTVTFSGDYPVSPVNNPFWAIEASVTRNLNNPAYYGVDDITDINDPTWLLNPAERISVKQAVEAYSINVAYQLFGEERFGSIKAGKEADFIVIDQDILKINPLRIDQTKVLATVFGGATVYDGGAFDEEPFDDVSAEDWFYGDVVYAYEKGLFGGTSETAFSPGIPMTRGMLVTVLYRLHGAPDVEAAESPFDDVSGGAYYADAVVWAASNGVVNGYGGGRFGPNDNITREQMATVLTRYMSYAEINLPVTEQYILFTDETEISDYAKEAVQVLYKLEIINGVSSTQLVIDPQGAATRAQVAAVLHRFAEKIG
ncbi:MAG: amidohydrolase family protein [Oscillospiraceae bacterium]|jgi:predicted amidohydrolase YtcJ|nr:amidohydrolase family protein [Oscillospiraceae bacterium]